MSWYRTYRPQTIAELDLPATRDSLERIRTSGSFSHAYLFTGPKGTGKTSSARILAKMLNCEKNASLVEEAIAAKNRKASGPFAEPCGTCSACQRIVSGSSFCTIEMDAASNRGIDDIRALRERIYLTPTDGRVSVYIIDEVHMLTTEAFNALLKVLEEPPAHVVFMLATTELHKVPETIISRCVVVQTQKAKYEHIISSLSAITKREHLTVAKEVLEYVAARSDGSFRDAAKLLESLAQGKTALTKEDIAEEAGSEDASLLEALEERNAEKVADMFRAFAHKDTDMTFVQKTVLKQAHSCLVEAIRKGDHQKTSMYQYILTSLNVPLNPLLPLPHLPFELACMAFAIAKDQTPMTKNNDNEPEVKPKEKPLQAPQPNLQPQKESAPAAASAPISTQSIATGAPLKLELLATNWPTILREIRQSNATLEALLRAARPKDAVKQIVTLEVFYSFHKEQLEHEKHRQLLERAIEHICQTPKIRLQFVLGSKPQKQPEKIAPAADQADDVLAKAAQEVFAA